VIAAQAVAAWTVRVLQVRRQATAAARMGVSVSAERRQR